MIRNILNYNNLNEDFTPGDEVSKLKYVKITSCYVERSSNKYKNLL